MRRSGFFTMCRAFPNRVLLRTEISGEHVREKASFLQDFTRDVLD